MNVCVKEKRVQAIKRERLLKAFEGVKYDFFAQWSDAERLTQELLGTDIKTILP